MPSPCRPGPTTDSPHAMPWRADDAGSQECPTRGCVPGVVPSTWCRVWPGCVRTDMALRPCLDCRKPSTSSRCPDCARAKDQARGTAAQRGYAGRGHQSFRVAVLARDPICKVCRRAPSTVADHYPTSRRDLVDQGLNPNDPQHGRGLCHRCHSQETARNQPGGWRISPAD